MINSAGGLDHDRRRTFFQIPDVYCAPSCCLSCLGSAMSGLLLVIASFEEAAGIAGAISAYDIRPNINGCDVRFLPDAAAFFGLIDRVE